jgi:hypothetical protein
MDTGRESVVTNSDPNMVVGDYEIDLINLTQKCRLNYKRRRLDCEPDVKVKVKWREKTVWVTVNGETHRLTEEDFLTLFSGVTYEVKRVKRTIPLERDGVVYSYTPCIDRAGNHFFVVFNGKDLEFKDYTTVGGYILYPDNNASICPSRKTIEEAFTEDLSLKALGHLLAYRGVSMDIRLVTTFLYAYPFITPHAEKRVIPLLYGLPGYGKTMLLSILEEMTKAERVSGVSFASIRGMLSFNNVIAEDVAEIQNNDLSTNQALDFLWAYFDRVPVSRVYTNTGKMRRYDLKGSLILAGYNVLTLTDLPGGAARRMVFLRLSRRVSPAYALHIKDNMEDIKLGLVRLVLLSPTLAIALKDQEIVEPKGVYETILGGYITELGVKAESIIAEAPKEVIEEVASADVASVVETIKGRNEIVELLDTLVKHIKKAKASGEYYRAGYLKVIKKDNVVKRFLNKAHITKRMVKTADGVVTREVSVGRDAVTFGPNELTALLNKYGFEVALNYIILREDKADVVIETLCAEMEAAGYESRWCVKPTEGQ